MFVASAEALLANQPLRATSSPAVQARAALSKDELSALEAVGLSTEPWPAGRPGDPLERSIIDYMALIETSLGTGEVARMQDQSHATSALARGICFDSRRATARSYRCLSDTGGRVDGDQYRPACPGTRMGQGVLRRLSDVARHLLRVVYGCQRTGYCAQRSSRARGLSAAPSDA